MIVGGVPVDPVILHESVAGIAGDTVECRQFIIVGVENRRRHPALNIKRSEPE